MKISVIIPVYNIGELVRHSINSVIEQRNADFEVIIVDDGSIDNSGKICDEYSYLENVTVIHKTNGGLSSARNAGLEAAKGDFMLFLDGDDYYRPGSLTLLTQIAKLQNKPLDFIQFKYDEVTDYSDRVSIGTNYPIFEVNDKRRMFEIKMELGGTGASACTKLMSRKCFDNLRFKEGIIHEDELFTMHLINNSHRVLYVDAPIYMYVQRQNSIITSGFSRKKLDIIPIFEEQVEILNQNGYLSLAGQVKNKIFSVLCNLYFGAKSSKDHHSAQEIKLKAQKVIAEHHIKYGGTYGLIAKGMTLGLPMMDMYYQYYKIRHGKNSQRIH